MYFSQGNVYYEELSTSIRKQDRVTRWVVQGYARGTWHEAAKKGGVGRIGAPGGPLTCCCKVILVILVMFGLIIAPVLVGRRMGRASCKAFVDVVRGGGVNRMRIGSGRVVFASGSRGGVCGANLVGSPGLASELCRYKTMFTGSVSGRVSPVVDFLLAKVLPLVLFVTLKGCVTGGLVRRTKKGGSVTFKVKGDGTGVCIRSDRKVHFSSITKRSRTGRGLSRVISCLRGPGGCASMNTSVPGNILLMKPPKANGAVLTGTITNRSGMPFFSVSNSRFIRVFINVKTSGIQSLFERTGRGTPYVIFVSRVSTVNGGHSKRVNKGSRERRALGRLLARVSKFRKGGNIVVLTTAGHPRSLSPTLAHPKHFSEHIPIRLPSLTNHRTVLGIRTGGVGTSSSISLRAVTHVTSNTSNTRLTGVVGRTTLHTIHDKEAIMGRSSLRRDVRIIVTKCRGGGTILSSRRGGIITCRRVKRTLMTTLRDRSTPIRGVAVVPHASNTLNCAVRIRRNSGCLVAGGRLRGGVTAFANKHTTRRVMFNRVAAKTSGSVRRTAGVTETVVAHCNVASRFSVITVRGIAGRCLNNSASLSYSTSARGRVSRGIIRLMGTRRRGTEGVLTRGERGLSRLTVCLCRGRAVANSRFVSVLSEGWYDWLSGRYRLSGGGD